MNFIATGTRGLVAAAIFMTTLVFAPLSEASTTSSITDFSYQSLTTPANLLTDVIDVVAVQCFSAGNCEALANAQTPNGVPQTSVVYAEVKGVWDAGLPIRELSEPDRLTSLSCSSPGNCAAVGSTYVGLGGLLRQLPVVFTETRGSWSANASPSLGNYTSNPVASLNAVSCPSDGTCVAVGQAALASGNFSAIVTTLADGNWSDANVVGPTSDGATGLDAISCPGAGSCVAAGFAQTFSGLVLDLDAGAWSEANVGAVNESLESVNCVSVGNCVAVGSGPAVVTQTHGTWSQSQLSNDGAMRLTSLSCPAAGYCVAVGFTGSHPDLSPVRAQEVNSVWSVVETPFNSLPQGQEAYFTAVSCGAANHCTATGTIETVSHFTTQAFVDTDVAGRWSPVTSTPFTSSLRDQSLVVYGAVSCLSSDQCTLGGTAASLHTTGASGIIAQTFPQTISPPGAPSVVGLKSRPTSVVFHVVAPSAPIAPLLGLQVVVSPANKRWTTLAATTRVVTLVSLKAHTRYTLHVRYLNAAGAGAGWKKTFTTP